MLGALSKSSSLSWAAPCELRNTKYSHQIPFRHRTGINRDPPRCPPNRRLPQKSTDPPTPPYPPPAYQTNWFQVLQVAITRYKRFPGRFTCISGFVRHRYTHAHAHLKSERYLYPHICPRKPVFYRITDLCVCRDIFITHLSIYLNHMYIHNTFPC